jgi:small subunit ribosomal protein S19
MSRSLKKGPFSFPKLLKKIAQAKASGNNGPIKTWSRASTILPEFVGMIFAIHNGKTFVEVLITEEMVGHKLGEFSPTTTFKNHGGKKADKK